MAFSRNGPDQLLLHAAVADRLSRGVDAAGERRVRNYSPRPDRGNEIVPADDAAAVLHQIDQQVEDLRLHMDRMFCAFKFAPLEINLVVAEAERHSWSKDIFGRPGAAVSRRLQQSLAFPWGG